MKDKKTISQSTFDDVVKENVEEFEMSPADAVAAAIDQMKAQNVDLSNIVTSLPSVSEQAGAEAIVTPSEKASKLVAGLKIAVEAVPNDRNEVLDSLASVKAECDVDLSHRCLVGSCGITDVLFEMLSRFVSDSEVLDRIYDVLTSLTNGQPDVISGERLFGLCLKLKEKMEDVTALIRVLKLIQNCCIKHEGNRQTCVDGDLIGLIMDSLARYKLSSDLVKICCSTLRTLIADDDVRVEFGRAHENAKTMVMDNKAIKVLLGLAKDNAYDSTVNAELFATVSNLAVRNEFCQEVVDEGGLQFLIKTVMEDIENQTMVRISMGLLRSISGNDAVKKEILSVGGVELVISAMGKHQAEAKVCDAGAACLAALALRSPPNCQAIIEAGGVNSLITIMKIHKDNATLQKNSCRAIRNLVARTRQFVPNFLEAGAEELINDARKRHRQVEDDGKAALRDLGCKVQLQEQWTGKKGEIKLND